MMATEEPDNVTQLAIQALDPCKLSAWRCAACGSMLAQVAHAPGSETRIKCQRCDALNVLQVK